MALWSFNTAQCGVKRRLNEIQFSAEYFDFNFFQIIVKFYRIIIFKKFWRLHFELFMSSHSEISHFYGNEHNVKMDALIPVMMRQYMPGSISKWTKQKILIGASWKPATGSVYTWTLFIFMS